MVKNKQSKAGRKDIMTEMFEHFGIKVIDVTPQIQKPKKKRKKLK